MRRSSSASKPPSFSTTPFLHRAESLNKVPFFQPRSAASPSSSSSSPTLSTSFLRRSRSTRPPTNPNSSFHSRPFSMSISFESSDFNFDQFVQDFKRNVSVKDRRWRLQTFKNCFVGSDAVQWMVTSGAVETRQDAIKLGLMMQESGLIEHCVRDHDFKDEELFYKFIENKERGGVPKLAQQGRLFSWADFMSSPMRTAQNLLPQFDNNNNDSTSVELGGNGVDSMFWPLDEQNVKLLDNVHPAGWIPPVFDGVYNVVVIGAGAGGLITASGAAGLGAKVALIEANALGGDCLNTGCVPSKALIHAANTAYTLRNSAHLQELGISFDGPVNVDFSATMERLRKVRAEISENDSASRFTRKLGVDVYFGYAKFTSETSVEVNGQTLNFKKATIATGASPTIPDIPGLSELYQKSLSSGPTEQASRTAIMTNETFFNMVKLPRRLAVIGTGVIGMELGQAMQRLGSSVTMFGRSGSVLPKEDEDLAEVVKQQMVSDGVNFRLDVSKYIEASSTGNVSDEGYEEISIKTIEKASPSEKDSGIESSQGVEKEYLFDAVLVATGRKPNVTKLNLEAAGVEFDERNGLKVTDGLQTTNARIFGVGDCCSAYKFTHAADFMARMVIRNMLFFGSDKMSNLLIPYATFTSPELAHVGLYEADLKRQGIAYNTFEKRFSDNDRAICDGATQGLVRIHVEDKSDAILGASILGSGAGNMISEITLAMQSKTGLGSLASVIHPYPTTAEAVRQIGDLYNRTRLTNTVRQVLRGLIKVQMRM